MRICALSLLVLATSLVVHAKDQGKSPAKKRAKQQIRAEDIGREVEIIGRLGIPIHQVIQIKGTWIRPDGVPKDNSLRFRVTHVGRRRLESPVDFHKYLVTQIHVSDNAKNAPKPAENSRWELTAWETGGFRGIPGAAYDSGQSPVQEPFGGFVTELNYTIQKSVR